MAEYINRQALLRYLNDIWLTATPNDFMPDDDRHLAMVRCMGLNDAIDAVKSIPAADVRPVVRGKWIDVTEQIYINGIPIVSCYHCNQCGETKWDTWTKFCPHCGAEMDGVE